MHVGGAGTSGRRLQAPFLADSHHRHFGLQSLHLLIVHGLHVCHVLLEISHVRVVLRRGPAVIHLSSELLVVSIAHHEALENFEEADVGFLQWALPRKRLHLFPELGCTGKHFVHLDERIWLPAGPCRLSMLHQIIFAGSFGDEESDVAFVSLRPSLVAFQGSATDLVRLQEPTGDHVVQHLEHPKDVQFVAGFVHEHMQLVQLVPDIGGT